MTDRSDPIEPEPPGGGPTEPPAPAHAAPHHDRPEPDRPLTRQERFEIIERSAIEAELETGRREPTIAAAKRSLLVRLVSGAAGVFLVLAGLAMLVLPGPGLIAIALGLGLLAPDVPFAARLLDRVKARLPQDEDGGLPAHVIVMMVTTAVVATGASVWWTLLR